MATAPFPFFSSPTYAYPFAACPPPASGFSPAPPFGYATFPSVADPAYLPHSVSPAPLIVAGPPSYNLPSTAAAYHHSFPSQIHTQNCQNWPPAAPTPIHGDLHHHHFLPTHDHLTVEATPQPSTASTAPSRELCPPHPQSSHTPDLPSSSKAAFHNSTSRMQSHHAPLLQLEHSSSTGQPGKPEKFVRKHMGSSTLPMDNASPKHCLLMQGDAVNQQRARDRISCDEILGEIARLSAAVVRLVGKKNNPSFEVVYTNEASEDFPTPQPQGSHNYSSTIAATACDKTQVPCEMRQSYGFNNLISQSVFLADSTERRYYALPEDYPLESSSVEEKVSVTAPVAEQAVGLAPILCSKANNIAVSESLEVHDMQPPTAVQDDPIGLKEMHVSDVSEEEKQQQDSENAIINVQQLGVPQLNVLVIHERINEWDPGIHALPSSTPDRDICYCRVPSRLINHEVQFLWDPGAATFLMTPLNDGSSNDPIGNEHVGQLVSSTGDFFSHGTTKLWSEYRHQYIVLPRLFTEVMLDISPAKPPENVLKTEYCREFSMKLYFWSATRLKWDPGVHVALTCPGAFTHVLQPIFASAISCSYAFDLGWTEVELTATAVLVGAIPCSEGKPVAKHAMFLSNGGCTTTNHCLPQLLMQSLCVSTTVQVTEQRHHPEFILMAEMLQTVSEFSEVQPNYSGIIVGPLRNDLQGQSTMSNTTCVWDPGIQFILSMLWWLSKGTGHVFRYLLAVKFGTHTYTYFGDTAASMCCPPANLIPHRRKFAALPQFCHSILLSSVVCVWDPRIALVYQQSVQMNYIARNLLSSQKYLLIKEMDIIFSTFRPP